MRQRALERETPLLPVLHSRLGRAAFPVLREMNDAADPQMLARDAVRTMRSLEARGPFFLVVFFSTAHFPYAAPSPYYRRFTDPSYRGRYKYDKPVGLGARSARRRARRARRCARLYDGAVAGDRRRRAAACSTRSTRDGIAKNTMVVVTGDHGETLYDHGHGQGHGDHLFGDEGTHVPLVIVDPRSAPRPRARAGHRARRGPRADALRADGRRARRRTSTAARSAPALDGRAAARPRSPTPRRASGSPRTSPACRPSCACPTPGIARLTEVDTQHGDELVLQDAMRPLTLVAKHRMVRDERYKLLYVPTRTGVRWMLFDTRADPGEERDVAAEHPDVVARLKGELWAWMRVDPDMTERGGYLVPRSDGAHIQAGADLGLVRLGDDTPPPRSTAPKPAP